MPEGNLGTDPGVRVGRVSLDVDLAGAAAERPGEHLEGSLVLLELGEGAAVWRRESENQNVSEGYFISIVDKGVSRVKHTQIWWRKGTSTCTCMPPKRDTIS